MAVESWCQKCLEKTIHINVVDKLPAWRARVSDMGYICETCGNHIFNPIPNGDAAWIAWAKGET